MLRSCQKFVWFFRGRILLEMWERIARRVLLTLSAVLALFLGYLLVMNADSDTPRRAILQDPHDQADAKLSEFTFTQSQGDVVQWKVRAKQARIFEQEKRVLLRDVVVTLYGAEGNDVTVQGEEGMFETGTKNFTLSNQDTPLVVETSSGYIIYTNHLKWTEDAKVIHTDDSVQIVGRGLEVTGKGLFGRMETEEFEILRDVHVDLAPVS